VDIQYEAPTWNQIYSMLLKQAKHIASTGFKPEVIVGVSRGGWLPARVLSDLLENSNLTSVKTEGYLGMGEAVEATKLTQGLAVTVVGKRVLVVDEVADSGRSLKLVENHVLERTAAEVKTATLYYKPYSTFKPDFYEKTTNRWVVFPWELKETVTKILAGNQKKPADADEELDKLGMAGVSKRLIARFRKEFDEANTC
jgi:uncharacterized protein